MSYRVNACQPEHAPGGRAYPPTAVPIYNFADLCFNASSPCCRHAPATHAIQEQQSHDVHPGRRVRGPEHADIHHVVSAVGGDVPDTNVDLVARARKYYLRK